MNIPEKIWKILSWVGIMVVVVLIIGALIGLKVLGSSNNYKNQTPPTISVDGTGDAVAVPDVATFSFSVTETAKTVADAQTAATTKINAALKVVKDAGVADTDVQTASYSINPHYEYQTAVCPTPVTIPMSASAAGGSASADVSSSIASPIYCPSSRNVLTGYDVSQSVTVKVRDLTKAGALFTAIGALGVQNVDSLAFSVDKPDAIQAEARSKAIANAQAKADELAKELNVHLVRVAGFSENNYQPGPIMYAMNASVAKTGAAAPTPEIPAGQEKVTDNVTITYEIQ